MSMDLQRIDLDTIQPNGKRGETQRPAFTKINQNFQQVGQAVDGLPGQLADTMMRAPARRNRLINGNFDIWQRGSSFGISGNYTADRWFLQMGNVEDAVFKRNPAAAGDNNFPFSTFTLSVSSSGNTDGTKHFFVFEQRVEDVRNFAGVESTVSFLVFNAGAAGRKIALEFAQTFGAGGSTPVLGIAPEVVELASGLNRIRRTVTLPSISGKALSGDGAAVVCIWVTAGTQFASRTAGLGAQQGQLYFGEFQWEAGPLATPFEWRPKGEELRLCQRYYQVDATGVPFDGGSRFNAGVGLIRGDNAVYLTYRFNQRMRSVPAVAFSNPSQWRLLTGDGATSLTALSAAEVTSTRMTIIGALNTAAAGQAGILQSGDSAAEGTGLTMDAEI
ncbi:hypothetical protein B9Y88_23170 [Stenotrophomonas maltophilia]|uniref:hypothetical protein n=1 Tax=Stenotrophomonas TaxID=40323 RepID=UPI000C26390A|nr:MULTISPECIES: hypothetical protein [unclassified Stenotrophomonas]MCU1058981.1 hypothetical protein [Stenotrophomonas maltophilia]MDH1245028.1 hypothetical protein [Stenotrophomonas sp. GD03948]MDH1578733.1 hypothetical protein [Stenotrophomonas sp. GD03744]PJL75679.1 hypothetical protein B9Y88_23170 [Stenotrophomonas maltophilia]PZT37765.1 hypothetical protein A7X94_09035 [Stenotrophomonas maltophilia]